MSQVQLILLAVEGCVVAGLACVYVWAITTQVAVQRFNLYNVFMVNPVIISAIALCTNRHGPVLCMVGIKLRGCWPA